MSNELIENNNKLIIYTTEDGQVEIEVRLEDENVWLTQNPMAELFDTTRNNITMHIKNIFEEGELQENSVSKESLLTAKDGKKYKTKFYNLDLIISVGYRVKSVRGTQFRIWANKLIKEYLIKGYNLNVDRFKNNGGDWIKELDGLLTMTLKDILEGAGTISHKKALEKAHRKYDKYIKSHVTQVEKDCLEIMGEAIKRLK